VICCESALAHICALTGTECWVPYSRLGKDYRLGTNGRDQVWSNHRVFNQGEDLRWATVFNDISLALEDRIHALDRQVGKKSARSLARRRRPRTTAGSCQTIEGTGR
jgi:hypothetical protein